VLADMRSLPHRGVTIHTDRLIYEVTVRGGNLSTGSASPPTWPAGTPWRRPRSCGCGPSRRPRWAFRRLGRPAARGGAGLPVLLRRRRPDGLHRAQRFAAYAIATDPYDRLLLTRIAPGYPGAGRWHLPAAAPTTASSRAPR
jgi:hypothetical protein